MSRAYLSGPGLSQSNHHEYTLGNLTLGKSWGWVLLQSQIWHSQLLLCILPVPASSNLSQASRQPEHCSELKDPTFLWLNPPDPKNPRLLLASPCLAPKGSPTAPFAQGLFPRGDRNRDVAQPRQMLLAKVPASPPGLEAWLARREEWPLPSLNQCVPPDCASWPCPGQRGTQHFVLARKEELKKRPQGERQPEASWGCTAAGSLPVMVVVVLSNTNIPGQGKAYCVGAVPAYCSCQKSVNEWQYLFLHWSGHRRPSMTQFSHQEDAGLMNHCLAVCSIEGCRRHCFACTWLN